MRRLTHFVRDLALLPAMWREAVRAERYRRYCASPRGLVPLGHEVAADLSIHHAIIAESKHRSGNGLAQQ